jgi:hypothetical protein
VVQEYEDILGLARKGEDICECVLGGSKEFTSLAEFILQNRPEFNAARFFPIDKSMLFGILNVGISFLLVIIQFKINP